MIYVHRNWDLVPEQVKNDLKQAAAELDAIADPEARKAYIKENQGKWSAVRDYLGQMSHRKCWYSEAPESVSRYQVDHFRPHGRAKQALRDTCDGYSWLAFDIENFRLAGVLCNTQNKEYSEETVGKGDWFPLLDPAKRASLAARDCGCESPILLDPIDPDDPGKLLFKDDGTVWPHDQLSEAEKEHVTTAIDCLGLRQSQLNRARKRVWTDCTRRVFKYNRIAAKPKGKRTPEEAMTLQELAGELIAMSKSASPFAAVARTCLSANLLGRLIVADEMLHLAAAD
ncbi:MAG: hypothetical protein KF892_22630 [Rhizobacter sp.]|nr:hypothetical protein [Rhizobacter sp.]